MKYIARQIEEGFEIDHIKEMTDIKGNKVEVIYGTNKMDKTKLEETIKDLKIQKKEQRIQLENDIKELESILNAINLVK